MKAVCSPKIRRFYRGKIVPGLQDKTDADLLSGLKSKLPSSSPSAGIRVQPLNDPRSSKPQKATSSKRKRITADIVAFLE